MTAFKLDTFGGMTPAIDDRLIGDRAAAWSENTWLYSGRLQGIPQPELVRACTAGTAKVFRLPNNFVDADHLEDSVWMEFENADTDIVRALVIGDTHDRYYWASSDSSPKYNTRARIAASSTEFILGIPAPSAPTLVVTGTGQSVTVTSATPGVVTWTAHGLVANSPFYFGGTTAPTGTVLGTTYYVTAANLTTNTFTFSATAGGTAIATSSTGTAVTANAVGVDTARAYLTTWVSAYDEEGPASAPVVKTGPPNGSWDLTLTAAAADDIGGPDRDLTHTNIYRTVTSSQGVATYFFVAQIPIATLSYSDTQSDATVSANSQIESTNWVAPPTDLQGIVAMPNGILAGWRLNEIWFCEPYRPHAWPAAYSIVVDYPIVGLGVTNQTLVVCTQGFPVSVSGIHPASMAQSKSASLEPCLSRGSIVSTTEGVYYASPNGLVFAGQGSINNITRALITKDKWHTLTSSLTLRAARLGTAYYAFGSARSGVFDSLSFDPLSFAQEDFAGSYSGVVIDPADQRVAFNIVSDRDPVTSVMNDPWSGEVFIIKDSNLYRLNLSNEDSARLVYKWRSKIFQSPKPMNLGAMRVSWTAPATAPDAAGTLPMTTTSAEFPELPVGSTYGVVRVYGDDELRYTHDLVTSGELIRPASGFKASDWQLEFETYLTIYSAQIASSVKALKGV